MSLAPLKLIDPQEWRRVHAVDLAPSEYPLHLKLGQERGNSYWWSIIAASLCVHAIVLAFATKLPSFSALRQTPPRVIVHRVPLYFPRDALTQRAPNKHEITKQLDLADLMDLPNQQAQRAAPDRSVRQFELPKAIAKKRNAKAPVAILPDAPAVTASQTSAPSIPGSVAGLASAPPPKPAASPGPFQNIGSEVPVAANPTLKPMQSASIPAQSTVPRSGSGSQTIISDDIPTQGASPVPGVLGQTGAQHAGVELKSDPQGMDMRPYLAQILGIVRGNWRRVLPQSVRMGAMRGKTVLEFIINRDGSIPKLVTAESSGQDPLDRAAVAGLSMSNPLPPLPAGFKGEQVRLAFSFAYNMAAE